MKKVIVLVLVIILAFSSFSLTAFAYTNHISDNETPIFNGATPNNIFGDLLNWNGIVFGNVNNLNSVEGTLAIENNISNSTTGLSVNGGIDGLNPASTEDVALLIGGNANINGYGNVWGQTVISNKDNNTYNLSNITPSRPDGWPREYTIANSSQYFSDARNTA